MGPRVLEESPWSENLRYFMRVSDFCWWIVGEERAYATGSAQQEKLAWRKRLGKKGTSRQSPS